MSGGDADHQVVRGVVGEGEAAAVDAVEGDDRGQPEALVAVDEGMVAGDGVQQGGGLGVQVRVGVLAERGGLRPGQGCFQEASAPRQDGPSPACAYSTGPTAVLATCGPTAKSRSRSASPGYLTSITHLPTRQRAASRAANRPQPGSHRPACGRASGQERQPAIFAEG